MGVAGGGGGGAGAGADVEEAAVTSKASIRRV